MPQFRSHLAILTVALLLGGCSWMDSVLTGEDTSQDDNAQAQSDTVQIPPSPAEQNPQPTVTQAPVSPPAPAPGAAPAVGAGNYTAQPAPSGGTYVGQKVVALRGDLQRLQASINQHNQELQQTRQAMASDSTAYYATVAAINARLQVGSTPGNPELVQQWAQAQAGLEKLASDIARLNNIANEVGSDSALQTYILQSVHAAYGLQGAVDEDHRQLATLENDCSRTSVLIDRLLADLNEDVGRQSNYVNNERRNLNMLSLAIRNGQLYGQGLNNRAVAGAAASQVASAMPAAAGRQPLMVIRFNKPNVAYEQALYSAVSRALDRRPGATFDVVAVSPTGGDAGQSALNTSTSKRNAESVVRSLSSMGLPPDRINLSAMSSASAQANEVQVFVR